VVRKSDARVCGLDLDRKNPIFLFNSSIDRYVQTFVLVHQFLRQGREIGPLPQDLEARVQSIDPDAYALSEWQLLVQYLGTT
jgi:hypothetical protein